MKLSIFTTATYPTERGDTYHEALDCYDQLADEVVTMRGEETWPKEFNWTIIGQHFQKGYEMCDGDWVIHADLDFIFHENDFNKIYEACKSHQYEPALSFYKYQFILPDRYNLKSRLVICVNKKRFGNRIKFNGGGDLCQPTLDGHELSADDVPESKIPFYNYEKISKSSDQVMDDVGRMDRAYFRHFGKYMYGDGTDEEAFNGWVKMMSGRFRKPQQHILLDEHPIFMKGTIATLKSSQWGFSGFGALEENDYTKEPFYA